MNRLALVVPLVLIAGCSGTSSSGLSAPTPAPAVVASSAVAAPVAEQASRIRDDGSDGYQLNLFLACEEVRTASVSAEHKVRHASLAYDRRSTAKFERMAAGEFRLIDDPISRSWAGVLRSGLAPLSALKRALAVCHASHGFKG